MYFSQNFRTFGEMIMVRIYESIGTAALFVSQVSAMSRLAGLNCPELPETLSSCPGSSVIFALLFVEFTLLFSSSILVLLVLRDQVIHVGLGLSELHLVHTLTGVPVQEGLAGKRKNVLGNHRSHLLDWHHQRLLSRSCLAAEHGSEVFLSWVDQWKTFMLLLSLHGELKRFPGPIQSRNKKTSCHATATRLNISWIAVELPANATAIFNPFGGMSQTDALMLLGIHSTK